MKNSLKKFILFIGLMLFTVVYAETVITVDNTKKGITDTESYYITNKATFTVNNVISTDSFKAYKILDAYYNENENTITYDFTSDFQSYLNTTTDYKDLKSSDYYSLSSGSITSGSTLTSSTLDKLVSGYSSYIKTNNVSGTSMTVSGNTATALLEAGSYLILPVSTAKVYAVMAEDDKYWNLNDETIVAKVSETGINKFVGDNKTSADYTINEIFTYTITATVIQYPTNATNKTFKIVDTFDNGITFAGVNTINVKDGETILTNDAGVIKTADGKVVATTSLNGNTITIDFIVDNLTSTTITVTYNASLNANAVCTGNKNTAKLVYSNDPYSDGTYETEEKTTTVYTYGIKILKYSGNNKTALLSGAKFEIYSDVELNNKVGEVTTLEDGTATFNGLKAGTYYLVETIAPTGHKKINDIISVDVVANDTTCYTDVEISNSKNGLLPFTGGNGSSAYTIIGGLLVVIGGGLMVYYRKKNLA